MMSCVTELHKPVAEWSCSGVPLTAFFNIERRHGKNKPVIKKALVELDSLPFRTFAAARHEWALRDSYRNPGPIQLQGSGLQTALCHTLALEYEERRAWEGGGGGGARPPAPPALSAEAAASAYRDLVAPLLASSAAPSVEALNKSHFFRLANKVTDEVHAAVLAKLGSSEAAWEALLAKIRAAESTAFKKRGQD
jgi:hypothetical protein